MKIEKRSCILVAVTIFLLYLGIRYWPWIAGLLETSMGAAMPLFIGAALAYAVNILMSFYERHFPHAKDGFLYQIRRPVCLLAALISLLAVIVLIIILIVPQLSSCIQILLAELSVAVEEFIVWLQTLDIVPEDALRHLQGIDWQSRLTKMISALISGVGNTFSAVIGTVSSLFGGVITVFLSFVFAIYLLMGKDKLAGQSTRLMRRYLAEKHCKTILHTLSVADHCFHKFIVGQCTEAVILGLLCAAGMFLLQLPYAAMIGALIGFTALIPVAGAYVGGAVGFLMVCTVSPVKGFIFLVFLVVLQQFEENVIYPRVVGSSMGLPGIWVLAAVTIGGGVMGIIGMLFGVPIAATAYRLLREDLNKADTSS